MNARSCLRWWTLVHTIAVFAEETNFGNTNSFVIDFLLKIDFRMVVILANLSWEKLCFAGSKEKIQFMSMRQANKDIMRSVILGGVPRPLKCHKFWWLCIFKDTNWEMSHYTDLNKKWMGSYQNQEHMATVCFCSWHSSCQNFPLSGPTICDHFLNNLGWVEGCLLGICQVFKFHFSTRLYWRNICTHGLLLANRSFRLSTQRKCCHTKKTTTLIRSISSLID